MTSTKNEKESKSKIVTCAPMPANFGISPDTEYLIDEIRLLVRDETKNTRKGVVWIVIWFSIIPMILALMLMMIQRGEDGGSLVGGLVSILLFLAFPIGGLFLWASGDAEVRGVKNEALSSRLVSYSLAKSRYQKHNNQEKHVDVEYLLTEKIEKHLDYDERRILNWGVHFCQIEDNITKVNHTTYLTFSNGTLLKERIGIDADELLFEMDNLPYSLKDLARVFEKAGNAAAKRNIKDSEILSVWGVMFSSAANNVKSYRKEYDAKY